MTRPPNSLWDVYDWSSCVLFPNDDYNITILRDFYDTCVLIILSAVSMPWSPSCLPSRLKVLAWLFRLFSLIHMNTPHTSKLQITCDGITQVVGIIKCQWDYHGLECLIFMARIPVKYHILSCNSLYFSSCHSLSHMNSDQHCLHY